MIVAGFGLRASANLASLQGALALAGNPTLDALAVVEDKANHPALRALSAELSLPLRPVALTALTGAQTPSPKQPPRYGANSVAEAAALAVAGKEARLIVARLTSPDGKATVAIAQGKQK